MPPDPIVGVLWLAMHRGRGSLSSVLERGTKPTIHGVMPTHGIPLGVRGCHVADHFRVVAPDDWPLGQLHLAGQGGSHCDRSGFWLVLTPDDDWDASKCVLHVRHSQAALFHY
jgi:hypothetical protein